MEDGRQFSNRVHDEKNNRLSKAYLLTFDEIKEERNRQRLREKDLILLGESQRSHNQPLRPCDVINAWKKNVSKEKRKIRDERERIENELISMEATSSCGL